MPQPDSYPDQGSPPASPAAIGRLAAIGGIGFLVASLAGDLVIGAFPGPGTPAAQLVPYYVTHHRQVLAGGMLLALGGVFFVLFGVAVWARIRQAPTSPLLAGLAVITTTLVALTTLASASAFGVLGDIGRLAGVTPAALQAWHIMAAEGSLAGSAATFLFLLTAAGAGLLARAVPRWLAWPALLLAVLQLLPDQVGFLASLVCYAWAAVTGIALLRRGAGEARTGLTGERREMSHA
jgi:hypothetical protein